jgi:hypothetical protein
MLIVQPVLAQIWKHQEKEKQRRSNGSQPRTA